MVSALRNVCGVIALSAGLLEAAVGTGTLTLGVAANWVAIAGIVAGVIYRGDWLHGPETPKPTA